MKLPAASGRGIRNDNKRGIIFLNERCQMSEEIDFNGKVGNIKNRYLDRTAMSKELNLKARAFLPGGDTRTATYYEPYPTYMVKGEGCYLFDVDNNQYIDFLNNYTCLIHGHNNPNIREAVTKQLESGSTFGAPHQNQTILAELLCDRVPSIEKVRFCNSGTEATMFSIRAARAFTGKNKIIKIEGGYHGTHDIVEVNVDPSVVEAGDPEKPNIVPYSAGIPQNVFENVIICPFNNHEAIESAINADEQNIAAIIVEPFLGSAGVIPAKKEYLGFLRKVTKKQKIVLIFDEVMSLRLSNGGAQGYYGVIPDLTSLGKIIGGGFPIGAFGGNGEIMSLFSPMKGSLHQSGTFNGHPITMAAGIASLKELTPPVYDKINSLGNSLRRGINDIFSDLKIRAQAIGLGSMLYIHYTSDAIHNYRDAKKASEKAGILADLAHLTFMNNGLFIAARGQIVLSTPMTAADIKQSIELFHKSFSELKPIIQEFYPHLII